VFVYFLTLTYYNKYVTVIAQFVHTGASEAIKEWVDMASAGARAYNGGLRVQGQSPWSGDQGAKPP